jgi:hypothetical protein
MQVQCVNVNLPSEFAFIWPPVVRERTPARLDVLQKYNNQVQIQAKKNKALSYQYKTNK